MTSELGTRLQLAAVGPQDMYVTSTAGTSPWLAVYKRPTRFALETVDTPFANGFVFGRKNRTEIPRAGDCLGGIALEIRLPVIPGAAPEDTWVSHIGYALLRRVRVWLDDTLLSDAERLWYHIHDRLFETKADALADMIGADPLPLAVPHILHVPLKLPFSVTNWLPTGPLGATRMTLEIDTESFEACIRPVRRDDVLTGDLRRARYVDATHVRVVLAPSASPRVLSIWTAAGVLAAQRTVAPGVDALTLVLTQPWSATLAQCGSSSIAVVADTLAFPGRPAELDVRCLVDVAFLDAPERLQFLNSYTQWHCETVLDVEAKTYTETVDADGRVGRIPKPVVTIDLSELNFPTRYLAWVVYGDGTFFDYATHAIESCRLWANNREFVPKLPGAHFQLLTKVGRPGVVASKDGVHFLSFAMHPAALQPSGSATFAKAKQPFLEVALSPSFQTGGTVKVFALVRRVLALSRGTAAFLTT